MKQLVLIITLLISFVKTEFNPIRSSSKIVVSPSINVNCTMGTVRVCHDSKQRLCHCKIDFDSSPLKTTKKCTNGTSLQWLEKSKKFTPICMKIVDPNKPLDCPPNYRLTNYKTNSSKLVSYCTKYFGIQDKIPDDTRPAHAKRYYGSFYLLSCETKKKLGLICEED